MSESRAKTALASLAQMPGVRRAHAETPGLFPEVLDRLGAFDLAAKYQVSFAAFGERSSVADWVARLLDHHREVQRHKPPDGKNPWFERFDDGRVMVRPGYLRSEGGRGDDEYVHGYRTRPLWSFAKDLRLVS